MRGGGRPTGEENDLEFFRYTPVPVGERGKGVSQGGERIAAQGAAIAQQVGRRHSAQVADQSEHIAVPHIDALNISDGQRKARADEQVACRSHVDRRVRAGGARIDLSQAGTQGRERIATEEGAQEQPVGPKRAPRQHQRPRHVVDRVEHPCRNDQVERCGGKIGAILVRLDAADSARKRRARVDAGDPGAGQREARIGAAQVEHVVKPTLDRLKPLVDAVEHHRAQEVAVRPVGRGAVTAQAAGGAVEDFGIVHCPRLVRGRGRGDKRNVRASIDSLVSLALPPRCPGCAAVVAADHRFCATCWDGLTFLGSPWCAGCALPFEHDRGPEALCGACLADPPPYRGARAAVAYGAVARTLALRLKYAGRAAFAETAARLMLRLMPRDAELLLPVPLHRWRLWGRGYNQAGLIARGLGRLSGCDVRHDLLLRTKATPVLRGLGGRGRAKAVTGAFALGPEARPMLKGRHVVLVDDVFTSGATATACTRLLLRGGAARVTVLCWARVIESVDADAGD